MGQSRQYILNTGRRSQRNLQFMGNIFITLLLIAQLSFLAAADDNNSSNAIDYSLSFFSNGSTRNYTPSEMEFGANVKESSSVKMNTSGEQTRKHVYIQFYERWPTEEQDQILENYGIVIIRGTAGHGNYIASMPASMTPADIPAKAGLRWMGEIPLEDKWKYNDPEEIPEWARLDNRMVIVWIWMHEDVSLNDSRKIRDKYANTSSIYEQYSRADEINDGFNYQFVTEEKNLSLMAKEDEIHIVGYIDSPSIPDAPPENDVSSSDNVSASSASENNTLLSVPGFELVGSIDAFIILFCMRLRK